MTEQFMGATIEPCLWTWSRDRFGVDNKVGRSSPPWPMELVDGGLCFSEKGVDTIQWGEDVMLTSWGRRGIWDPL